ncbi:MAG: hypothetical protein NVS1B4_17660 [Gemmatimonadaceae bacterium]
MQPPLSATSYSPVTGLTPRASTQGTTADRRRAALATAVCDVADAREAMRAAVREYTQALRMEGALPEHVLVAVKSAVRSAPVPGSAAAMTDALVADAAQWCIASFFGAERRTLDGRGEGDGLAGAQPGAPGARG